MEKEKQQTKEPIKENREIPESSEVCIFEDRNAGLFVQLTSSAIPINQLLDLGATAFNFLKTQRQANNKPSYI